MDTTYLGLGLVEWGVIVLGVKAFGDVVVKATPSKKDDLVWDVICCGVRDAVKAVVGRAKKKV